MNVLRTVAATLAAVALLVTPATAARPHHHVHATALTHRQRADQHAYAHCVLINCEYGFDHVVAYAGGREEYFYWMTWRGYGFHCHYGPPLPSVVISDDVSGDTEHNWTSANAFCAP